MGVYFGKYKGTGIISDGLVMSIDMANSFSYRSGASGLRINDLSGRNANAIMSSSNYTSDAGGGLSFSAKTDGVTGLPGSITVQNTFSLGVWLYPTTISSTAPIFTVNSTADFQMGLHYYGSSGTNTVAARFSTTGVTREAASSTAWGVGAYQYYVMTYDGTNLIFYKNASSIATNSSGGTYANSGVAQDYLIGSNNRQAFALNARIYMAHIYNRALSATEVTQNYNAHRARFGL